LRDRLSDPPTDWDAPAFAAWFDDIDAVIEAAGLARPVLVSSVSAAMVAAASAARRPGAIDALVLLEPSLPERYGPDATRAQLAGEVHTVLLVCPSRADEATHGCVGRRGGTVVKSTGDGVLALFPSATGAVRAARELHARIMALAESGEVLVSDAVPPALVGSGIEFSAPCEHTLKGVPGRWRVWALVD
jgi:pimeloyl-ACP methyl ester carboxylesterase